MQAPVAVAPTQGEAEALLVHVPADRRPHVTAGTPEQTAEALQPYLAAGFTGFTFNSTIYRTPEAIGYVGELLRLVEG
jgi:alkanesulfonate monooxygenase SsuD/methylene tetrahydromethanopterin reductase-like flavin-dependent oxidoreductase (luciferase family)